MNKKYKFNPFSGIMENDLEQIIVPIFDFDEILYLIQKKKSIAIELLGKKGRGKTTHLKALHKKIDHYPLFLLDATSDKSKIINTHFDVIFIDSIHHLNINERVQLFKKANIIIYTTHFSRKIMCKLIHKKIKTIPFKGINLEILKTIITKRLTLAKKDNIEILNDFSDIDYKNLIQKFGDNYRGILNHLYEQYQ